MTMRMVAMNTEVDLSKKTIYLPKVSLHDFSTKKMVASGTCATAMDCVRALLFYFSPEDRAAARRIVEENIHVNVRFRNQSMRCRKLRVYNPKESAAAKGEQLNDSQDDFDITNGDFLADIYQEIVN